MTINQVSVFLDNKPGRLAEVTKAIAQDDINIRALYVADTTDFGVLRMIVDKPEKTLEVLKNSGFTAKITPVIAIYVEDRPGGLYNVIKELSDAGISIEYVYAFTGRSEKSEAGVVVKVEHVENWSEEDFKTLKVKLLSREDIANLFE